MRQQTALLAGSGGFDIQVNGHTHLQGAAISSEAAGHLNRLSTHTLTHEDVVNRDVAQGRSRSVGIASSPKTVDGQNVRNLGTSSVGYARIETNQSNVTPSSIAPATLTLARPDLQGQAAARMKAAQREPLLHKRLVQEAGFAEGTFAHELLVSAVATAVGAGVGGRPGAAAASNSDTNNRQVHYQHLMKAPIECTQSNDSPECSRI